VTRTLLGPLPPLAEVAAYVDAAAPRLGLRLTPAQREAVVRNLAGLLAAAEFLGELPLPETVEGAPVFRP
jgi:hypothetical protein